MANKEFNTRISLKYDTYENWQTNNPVLLAGEVAITVVPAETGAVVSEPAVLFKVGDGTSTYSQLQFVSALSADVYGWAKAANKPTYNASEIEGLSDFISGEINDTNTTYKIEQDGSDAHKLILYSKEAGSPTWNPVSTITTVDTIYDDTELNNEIDALKDLIGETGVAAQIAAALGALDKSDSAVGGQFVTSVSQTDGVVSVTRAALQASDIPALGVDKITGLQTALDSKASADALSTTDGKVTTLIGDDTAKSVRTIANEELAAQLIPEGAAESLNTLQEIAAWIQEHPDDASAMNSAITALQAQLAGIGSGSGTVKAYVDAAISALNIGDYVTASALAAAIGNLDVDDAAVEGQVVSAV